jgi:hypothetical protein
MCSTLIARQAMCCFIAGMIVTMQTHGMVGVKIALCMTKNGYLSKAYNILYSGSVYSSVSYTFNNLGQLTMSIAYDSSGVYTYRTQYAYNSDGNMVLQKDYIWGTQSASFFQYEEKQWVYNGLLMTEESMSFITSGPTTSGIIKKWYTYDSYGRPLKDSSAQWDVLQNYWWPLYAIKRAYDTSDNKICEMLCQYSMATLKPMNYTVDSSYYDTEHNVIYTVSRYYDSAMANGVNKLRTYTTYNVYHQPEVVHREVWNNTSKTWMHGDAFDHWVSYYYYEEYEPQAVVDIKEQEPVMMLYPNPAKDRLTLRKKVNTHPVIILLS